MAALCQSAFAACKCKDSSQLCGSQNDLGIYYACSGKDTLTLECPAGSGFLFDKDTTGCVPFTDARWSCINPLKTLTVNAPKKCTSEFPIAAGANNFWVCKDQIGILTSCVASTPFFYGGAEQLGCYNFTDWVKATGCSINTSFYF